MELLLDLRENAVANRLVRAGVMEGFLERFDAACEEAQPEA